MASVKRKGVPAQVRGVEERFERWRSGKQGKERIPPRLWDAAVGLCGNYSIHKVSRWLRINHTALQKRAHRRSTLRPRRPKAAFVEWRLPAGTLPGASSAEYVVEALGREDGTQRIHVRGGSVGEMAALLRGLRSTD